ncbi:GntR family transcriptional regulator [Saccharomonospora viridis]|uniref:GntR family transcriptional regulator n=1 Tax=Saccharomonospora viridis TaxID=1852 RepID=UPI0009457A59
MRIGATLLPITELASRYHVGVGTVHRALTELKSEGLVRARRGQRAVVTDRNFYTLKQTSKARLDTTAAPYNEFFDFITSDSSAIRLATTWSEPSGLSRLFRKYAGSTV